MREKFESYNDIKGGIRDRTQENKKRAEKMGLVVKAKKITSETSSKLRISTTSDGAKKVKDAIEKAAKKTHDEFKKQNKDLKKKTDKCKAVERDLGRRVGHAKDDARDSKGAAKRTKGAKETKRLLNVASEASIKDAKATEGLKNKQKDLREGTIKQRDKQKTKLVNTKLKWRN